MSAPPSATTSIILDRIEELRDDQRAQYRDTVARMERVEASLREQSGQLVLLCQHQEGCERWREKHKIAHGIAGASPSPWVANTLAMSWHRRDRIVLGLLLLAAVAFPAVQARLPALLKMVGP